MKLRILKEEHLITGLRVPVNVTDERVWQDGWL